MFSLIVRWLSTQLKSVSTIDCVVETASPDLLMSAEPGYPVVDSGSSIGLMNSEGQPDLDPILISNHQDPVKVAPAMSLFQVILRRSFMCHFSPNVKSRSSPPSRSAEARADR